VDFVIKNTSEPYKEGLVKKTFKETVSTIIFNALKVLIKRFIMLTSTSSGFGEIVLCAFFFWNFDLSFAHNTVQSLPTSCSIGYAPLKVRG
jgi:hypothetical protein